MLQREHHPRDDPQKKKIRILKGHYVVLEKLIFNINDI